jgi:hypothetical protein
MSSSDPGCRFLLIACAAFAVLAARPICAAQNQTGDHELSCPATIDVSEQATPVAGWEAENSAAAKQKFERVSIYNGQPGGKEFDLAPDDQKNDHGRITQVWHLEGYRDMNLFLRCRYRNTQAVLYRNIPAGLKNCTFIFIIDKSGKITETLSFACR